MHSVPKKVAIKRKIDPSTNAKEIKVKKVDTNMKVKKSATKAELIFQLEELLSKYDALEKEHNQNIDLIARLMKNGPQIEEAKVTHIKETQTVNDTSKCIECDFESLSNEDVKWHMHETHGWSNILFISDDENDNIEREPGLICKECQYKAEDMYDYDAHVWSEICTDPTVQKPNEINLSLSCNFCEDKFRNLGQLMKHKKLNHTEHINQCWNFASGECEFKDSDCWFLHDNTDRNEFQCTSCDDTFAVKAKFFEHRKKHHAESTQKCRNVKSGTCRFGSAKCWFDHSDAINTSKNNDEKLNPNGEDIEKLFQMMEKFTQQIVEIKEYNNMKT